MYGWIVPKHKRIVKTLIILIIIVGLAFGAYFVGTALSNKSSQKNSSAKKTTTTPFTISNTMESYTSDNLGDTFSYPSGWTITDNAGSNELSVTSPILNLENSADKTVKGKITMVINQNTTPVLSGFKYGDAVSVIESPLITYTQPSQDQLATAYISLLAYAGGSSSLKDFGGIYITGNLGYTAGQAVPETAIYQVSPIVYIYFTECNSGVCNANSPALNIPVSLWNKSSFQKPLLTMLESISFD